MAEPPESESIQRVAIVGVGLIGASFALAMRQAGFKGELTGVSSPRSIEAGIKAGAIERGVSLVEAAATSDLIYLAQPIEDILRTLTTLGPAAWSGCLITDAGSTKIAIVDAALRHVANAGFLGGHPMAGKELRGAEAADANLFRGRPYVLTPTGAAVHSAEFRLWLERIGAHVREMSAAEHDHTVALTSHLPQLLSTSLAAMLARQDDPRILEVFGPGLLDMTRLALSAPEVWMSVIRTNRSAIAEALSGYKSTLDQLQIQLEGDDVEPLFALAAKFATLLRKRPLTDSTVD